MQDTSKTTTTISGTIIREKFYNAENDYGIFGFLMNSDSSSVECTIKGTGLPRDINDTTTLKLYGIWETDKQGREAFKVSLHEVILPKEKNAVIKFLSSLGAGVGKVIATRLWDAFEADVFNVIENNPSALLEIRGMTEKIIEKLQAKVLENKEVQNLMLYCDGEVSVSNKTTKVLRKNYGKKYMEVLERSAFYLMPLKGVSYETAEKLYVKKNGDLSSSHRIKSCAISILLKHEAKGHTCMPIQELEHELNIALFKTVSPERIHDVLLSAIMEKDNSQSEHDYFCLKYVNKAAPMVFRKIRYMQEMCIAKNVARLNRAKEVSAQKKIEVLRHIREIEQELGISLTVSQKAAIMRSLENNLSIITGGAGTGKTTITQILLKVHEKMCDEENKFEPVLLSPTGRAARRLSEVTGHVAATTHSRLKIDNDGVSQQDTTLTASIVILDEAGMLENSVADIFFESIEDDTTVVLVGDVNQLKSVGAGAVLQSLIDSDCIPTSYLDVVFRQGKENTILKNSDAILDDRPEDIILNGENFHFEEIHQENRLTEKVVWLYNESIRKFGTDQTIILCPLRKYSKKTQLTTFSLNNEIQAVINPPNPSKKELIRGSGDNKTIFRTGDRVIQLKNQTGGAQNGDVGIITYIGKVTKSNEDSIKEEDGMLVWFKDLEEGNQEAVYTKEDIYDLDLGYAISVHKSQGSEYDVEILISSPKHHHMLKKHLLYTAVTRAKKQLITVGSVNAFKNAISISEEERQTQLKSFILAYDNDK